MAGKGLLEGTPTNIPDLGELRPICLMTKETKIPRGPTANVSKFPPVFML